MDRLGYYMFIDDINKLRNVFISSMYESLEQQAQGEINFNTERQFMMMELKEKNALLQDLHVQFRNLSYAYEQQKSRDGLSQSEQYIDQVMQKAYYSYELLLHENKIKEVEAKWPLHVD